MSPIFLQLSSLVMLLISLVFLYGLAEPFLTQAAPHFREYGMGMIFGAFAMLNMQMPIHLAQGVIVDARYPLIVLAGVFGGWKAGLTSAGIVCAYRLHLGGIGAPYAVGAIVTSALLGIGFHGRNSSIRALALLSGAIVLSTYFWVYATPNVGLQELREIAVPIALLYPVALFILETILSYQQQQRSQQRALAESERRFHAIFDQTFQFMGLLQPDGILLEANQTALDFGGLSQADVIGRPFWEARWWTRTPETQQQLQSAIQDAARGVFVRYEVDMQGAQDRVITVDFSLKPIADESGHIVLLIPEGRDISDRKRAEQRERELVVERERIYVMENFVNEISHDLRTPISIVYTSTAIIGIVIKHIRQLLTQTLKKSLAPEPDEMRQILETVYRDTGKIDERIPVIEENATRLKNIITNLTEIVRAESESQYQRVESDLNMICERGIHAIRLHAAPKKIKLTFEPQENLSPVLLDAARFDRVIQNLLDNAIQYTPMQGQVTLRTYQDNQHIVMEVSDTGIGISPEDMPHVFERFYRSEEAKAHRSEGTGLGLAIVQKIVEMHRGSIELESTPGIGTTFRVLLPLSAGVSIVPSHD